jgi:MFS transporter, DHA3 family, tetracycline resistance protein
MVYLSYAGLSSFLFASVFTISAVYRVQEAGLNPLQLVLVGTILELTAFIFEVPTGVVADVYSRRLSVILGVALLGLSFLLEGLFPLFGVILAAQVVAGIGYTFLSGADSAWIADEVGEARVSELFLRAAQVGQVAGFVGIGAGVGLASLGLQLPFFVAGGLFLGLAGFLLLVMPETGFAPAPRSALGSGWALSEQLASGLEAVRVKPLLITMLAIAGFFGMASESFDRLWQLHFLTNFSFPALGGLKPVVWFGIVSAIAVLVGILAVEVARRVVAGGHLPLVRALFAVNAALTLAVACFALADNFTLAVACYVAATTMRRLHDPLFHAWINQGLSSRVRATVLSMAGQMDALGQILGGPLLGLIATAYSLRPALAALVLLPAVLLYLRVWQGRGIAAAEAVD